MSSDARWTLDELGAEVERALAVGYEPAASARVRAVPDRRTIRYYTTLGLVDRPRTRGRTAYYGRRHLLQLVAIKRLQAEGLRLAEVQHRLAGLPDAELEAVARLPAGAPEPVGRASAPEAAAPRRDGFWRAPPAPAPAPASTEPPPAPGTLHGLELDAGVTLLLAGGRRPAPEDMLAIREAAGPLLDLLSSRGLLPGRSAS